MNNQSQPAPVKDPAQEIRELREEVEKLRARERESDLELRAVFLQFVAHIEKKHGLKRGGRGRNGSSEPALESLLLLREVVEAGEQD